MFRSTWVILCCLSFQCLLGCGGSNNNGGSAPITPTVTFIAGSPPTPVTCTDVGCELIDGTVLRLF